MCVGINTLYMKFLIGNCSCLFKTLCSFSSNYSLIFVYHFEDQVLVHTYIIFITKKKLTYLKIVEKN